MVDMYSLGYAVESGRAGVISISAFPRVAKYDFDPLRKLMTRVQNFPPTYENWLELWTQLEQEQEQEQEHADGRRQVVWIDVHVTEFESFCRQAELIPTWQALMAFVRKRSERD